MLIKPVANFKFSQLIMFFLISTSLFLTTGCFWTKPTEVALQTKSEDKNPTEKSKDDNKPAEPKPGDPKPPPQFPPGGDDNGNNPTSKLSTMILCQSRKIEDPKVSYFSTESGFQFIPSYLGLSAEQTELQGLFSPVAMDLYESELASLILNKTSQQDTYGIYGAQFNLKQKISPAALLHSFPVRSSQLFRIWNDQGLKASPLYGHRDSQTWIAPSENGKGYEQKDFITSQKFLSIELSPEKYVPLVGNSELSWMAWGRVDKINKTNRLRISLLDMSDAKRVIDLEPLNSDADQISPIFSNEVGQTVFWQEKWSDSKKTYYKIRSFNFVSKEISLIFSSESELSSKNWAPHFALVSGLSADTPGFDLNNTLVIISNKDLTFVSTKDSKVILSAALPSSLTSQQLREQPFFLATVNYVSWENKLFFSNGTLGGLFSFDVNKKSWKQHGRLDSLFPCHYPSYVPYLQSTRGHR
jgi:hypothetical protein